MIRRSGREEAEEHFAIQRAACLAGLPHIYPPELYPFPDEEIRRRWREWGGTVLVSEREGRLVGVAGVERCWLHGFYVLPELWGTGVAAELHDAALAEQPDCPDLRLWVLEENHRARRFYEKHGWRENGETRIVPYPPHPLDVGYTYVREEP
ncbi:MAG TPA: GNAT family N-acetyltransferase [Gaiellaceae bacterium]|nr:GNAT family N-acetyltransferase [Gaiellaceae bacterium]